MIDSTATNKESNTNKIGEEIACQEKNQNSQGNFNEIEDPKLKNDNEEKKTDQITKMKIIKTLKKKYLTLNPKIKKMKKKIIQYKKKKVLGVK